MDLETLASLAFGIAVLAFLWNLHMGMGVLRRDLGQDISNVQEALGKDISDLRDRVTGLEDRVSGLEYRVSRLEDRVSGLEDRVARVENRVARVEGMLAGAGLKVAPEPASG